MRLIKNAILLVLIFSSLSLFEYGNSVSAASKPLIKVIVDGAEIKLPVNPIEVKGSAMLHAKSIFDALKISSKFDKKRITVNHGGVTFKAEVNQTRIYIGNRELRLTQPPIVKDGRTYVPARFIAIVLGKDVKYDSKNSQLVFGLTEDAKKALLRSLFEAARKGDAAAVTSLIKRGADPNGKLLFEYLDNTPLNYAILNNRTDAARALLNGGATIKDAGPDIGFSVIVLQNAELLDLLLTSGLDPNHKDRTGSLLESASGIIGISENGTFSKDLYPSPALVNTLLKHGADPGIDNSLYRAVHAQNYSIVQALLKAGADPYKANQHGTTPYDLSVQRNINRWLIIQKERVGLPTLSITDAKGNIVENGNLNLRSMDDLKSPQSYVDWTAGQIHVDEPNGKYQIVNVTVDGGTYILPHSFNFTIQGETVTPSTLKLPEFNVSGTLSSELVPIDGGYIMLYHNQTSTLTFIKINAKSFNLYAPAGQYRIVGYRDASNKPHSVEADVTITNTGGVQAIAIDLKKVDNPMNPS